jgi:hypothetical protein
VPGYDDRTSENSRKEKARSEDMRLCCQLCQIVDYIFVDRSGQKRELVGETRPELISGERRRQENLELACIAEPISNHNAYPRGSWLREVSIGSKLGRSQVLTDQVQTDQKGQPDLLSNWKGNTCRSKTEPVKFGMLGMAADRISAIRVRVRPLPCCPILAPDFYVSSARRKCHKC